MIVRRLACKQHHSQQGEADHRDREGLPALVHRAIASGTEIVSFVGTMNTRPFDASRDLKTDYRGSTKAGKTVTCVACGLIVFDLPEQPTVSQREAEGLRLAAHLEFTHDMV